MRVCKVYLLTLLTYFNGSPCCVSELTYYPVWEPGTRLLEPMVTRIRVLGLGLDTKYLVKYNQKALLVLQNKFCDITLRLTIDTTSTAVFYRTRVYQMQPRNGQNWHFSVGKYVHHNRETAKIEIRTHLKPVIYFRFVSQTTRI